LNNLIKRKVKKSHGSRDNNLTLKDENVQKNHKNLRKKIGVNHC
jgi:hypothetical protein